jgi:membrane protein required for colicin V production
MIIDIIFLVFMIMAVVKGLQRGLIVAVFSIVAFIVGLAAALKLSAVVAVWLGHSTNINVKWLPVIAFLLVFLAVVLAIRWGAKLMEKAAEVAFLGSINKIGGVLLYVLLYSIIFSVLLFYTVQFGLFTQQAINESKVYIYIQPWGPRVIDTIGIVIPVFKNVFSDLQEFFGNLGGKLSS